MITPEKPPFEILAAESMAALVCERYGTPDVLRLTQLSRPSPKPDEILIRVKASALTSGDRRVRSMHVPHGFHTLARLALGWNAPRNPVLGAAFAGVVQAIGSRAKGFRPGDAVFGIRGFRMGGHAEYLCMSADGAIAHKPERLSFEEAASLPFGGGAALFFLRRSRLLAGETILINGASGNVGTAAVQLSRDMGGMVTGVCNGAQVDLVHSLGATQVIDYSQQDFTAMGQSFDVVFDAACNYPVGRCVEVLKPGGRLVRLQADLPEMLQAMLLPRRLGRQVIAGTAEEKTDDLKHLAAMVVEGRYRPVIARVFPFEEAIEAHRYADRPGLGGSVVIRMSSIPGGEFPP